MANADIFEYINYKIETIKDAKQQVQQLIPAGRLAKIKFNLQDSQTVIAIKAYRLALSITGRETGYTPVENYDIVVEALKILEDGLREQAGLRRLCVYANALKLNDRVQNEFDDAVRKNNKDRCLVILADERRKTAELEAMERRMAIRVEHDKFRKNVLEVQHVLCTYMDEDGRPKFKHVNVGMMNDKLRRVYTKQEILEGYKEFLDTEPYSLLLKMIDKKLSKEA